MRQVEVRPHIMISITSEERLLPAIAIRHPIPRTAKGAVVLERSFRVSCQLFLDIGDILRLGDCIDVWRILENTFNYGKHVFRLRQIQMLNPSDFETLLEQVLVDLPGIVGPDVHKAPLRLQMEELVDTRSWANDCDPPEETV